MNTTSTMNTTITMFRVGVLYPLKPRQRKQTKMLYRVGASTPAEAIEAVRRDILQDPLGPAIGARIISCALSGDPSRVVCDGVVHVNPEDVASLPSL